MPTRSECFNALAKFERKLPKDHPDYGKVLLDLALVYRDEGKYAKAQTLCTQATKIIQTAIGQNNIDIANCWDHCSVDRALSGTLHRGRRIGSPRHRTRYKAAQPGPS